VLIAPDANDECGARMYGLGRQASTPECGINAAIAVNSWKEQSMKRAISLLMLVLFSASMLSACNTMAGAGKDVQKAGEKVEEAADRHK
jgi:entericidin A